MKIDTSEWKDFCVGELFSSIYKVASYHDDELTRGSAYDESTIAYVTRTDQDNGVKSLVRGASLINVESGNAIVIGDTTSTISYQPSPFVAGEHIIAARADWLNKYTGLFITCLMRQERYRYSYGRAYKLDLIRNTKLKLPVTTDGKPDWHWIESYVDSLHSKPLTTSNAVKPRLFDTRVWKWFKLGGDDGLFDIRKGKRLTSDDQTDGSTPYIGAIDSNNGVSNYIGQNPIHGGNTISLSYNGSVGEAFYQPVPYWATDDVNALYLHDEYGTLTPATGLFVCTVLKHDKYRYSYGRKWTLDNMNDTMVKLPATPEGKPDWQYMENYIKSLPYGDRL
jgi:hypothetical protein